MGSLLHLIFNCYEIHNSAEIQQKNLEELIKKIAEIFPDKPLIFVFDQINEVNKGRGKDFSERLFEYINKLDGISNVMKIFCASNNNEFNRDNMTSENKEMKM